MKRSSRNKFLFALAVGTCAVLTAQAQRGYGFARPLDNVRAGWNSIEVDQSWFARINSELSDIRIWRIVGKDTTEVPYVLQEVPPDTILILPNHYRKEVPKPGFALEPVLQRYRLRTNIRQDRAAKITEITIDLPAPVPIHLLSVHIADTFDYRRDLRIEKKISEAGSARAGKKPQYQTLGNEQLISGNVHQFTFQRNVAEQLRLIIKNEDNAPLDVDSVTVKGPKYQLMARFPADGDYLLAYGNPDARAASYDIINFAIPAAADTIVPGPERAFPGALVQAAPKDEQGKSKVWLYVLMGALVLLIGGFTFSMMRSKAKEEEGES